MASMRPILSNMVVTIMILLFSVLAAAQGTGFTQSYCSSQNTGTGDACEYTLGLEDILLIGSPQSTGHGRPTANVETTAPSRVPSPSLSFVLTIAGARITFLQQQPICLTARSTVLGTHLRSVVTRMRASTSTSSSQDNLPEPQGEALDHLQQK